MNVLRSLICLLICGFAAPALATDAYPPTFLVKNNDRWTLPPYVGGHKIVVWNKDADTKTEIRVKGLLPEEEYDRVYTSAGPRWDEYSLWCFSQLAEKHVFRVRTRYGTDVLIDLENAKAVNADKWHEELQTQHEAEIKKILKNAATLSKAGELTLDQSGRVQAAIVHAMLEKLKIAIGHIRELENVDYVAAPVQPNSPTTFTKQDPWFDEWRRYMRQKTHRLASLAVQKLGEVDKTEPPDVNARIQALSKKVTGLDWKMLYDVLGTPESLIVGGARYDFGGSRPYSVRVLFDESGIVDSVERVKPLSWREKVNRAVDGVSSIMLYSSG